MRLVLPIIGLTIAALSGCASQGIQSREVFQVVDERSCHQPMKQAGWSGCPQMLVEDQEGNLRRLLIVTSARPGDYVALRCRTTGLEKTCNPRARKIAHGDVE